MKFLVTVLLIGLATATQYNKQRFNRLLRSYGQQGDDWNIQNRRFGGLHDVLGGGGYGDYDDDLDTQSIWGRQKYGRMGQMDDDDTMIGGGWNRGQCQPDEFDQYGQCYGGDQWGQQQGYGDEYGMDNIGGQYGAGLQDIDTDMDNIGMGGGVQNIQKLNILEHVTNHLATGLYKQAKQERDDKNVVVSPVSVLIALGALSVGAKGHTKNELSLATAGRSTINPLSTLVQLLKRGGRTGSIGGGLDFDDYETFGQGFGRQQSQLGGIGGYSNLGGIGGGLDELDIDTDIDSFGQRGIGGKYSQMGGKFGWGNMGGLNDFDEDEYDSFGQQGISGKAKITPITGIFVDKMTPVQQQFIRLVQGQLGCKVQKCDFQRNPQQCRQMINRWVSIKSHHNMNRLVPKDAITDNTKMLVVTGLQVKAKWGKQFRNHQTSKNVFHPLDGRPKLVPVMKKVGVFKYHETETVKVVGIPTQGNDVTLFVVLPKYKDGITDLEKEKLLEGEQLKRLLDNCERRVQKVKVQLPKFQCRHKIDAKRTLIRKGLNTVFESQLADFAGITGCYECSRKANQKWRHVFGIGNQFQDDWMVKRGQIHVNKLLTQAIIKVTDQGITTVGQQGTNIGQEYGGNQFQDMDDDQYNIGGYRTNRQRFDDVIGLNRFGQSGLDNEYELDGQFGNQYGLGGLKNFNAKHPFAFVVRHNPTKQVLLIGRVIDAGQKQTGDIGLGGIGGGLDIDEGNELI